jgi:hypothetical protein
LSTEIKITADASELLAAIEDATKKAVALKQALAHIGTTPIRIVYWESAVSVRSIGTLYHPKLPASWRDLIVHLGKSRRDNKKQRSKPNNE